MSLFSRILGHRWHLPPVVNRRIKTEELRILMRDGVELLAKRYYAAGVGPQPVVLVRSCYGIAGPFGLIGTLFAERGFQVILQNCRGIGGSQGVFRPFFDEQNDGEDTVHWIVHQSWFAGELALWGGSYLGNTAWAIANSPAVEKVKAMGLHVTLTNFHDRTYAFGGYTLEAAIGWTLTMSEVERNKGGMNLLSALTRMRRSRILAGKAISVLPLKNADKVVNPQGISWWQDWMDHAEPGDPYWKPINYGRGAENLPAAVLSAGWCDIFLPWQIKDFVTAQNAGRSARLIIGPWMHADMQGAAESIRETMALFQEQFGLVPKQPKPAVRLFLMAANEWRDYPAWPVPNAAPQSYFLRENGALSSTPPSADSLSKFDFDPAQPTPSLYGPTIEGKSGSGDMAPLERRSDVLLFTSEPLASQVDVIGSLTADIYLRSNSQHTDLYLCLCDVDLAGLSKNVCDGYRRLRPELPPPLADGQTRKVTIEFWPTAYRFQRGHRLRIIVAGGAHPRYVRNPGTGAPLGEGETMITQHQEILHGPECPSAIHLSVVGAS